VADADYDYRALIFTDEIYDPIRPNPERICASILSLEFFAGKRLFGQD
jgi:hypothetical protein